MVIEGKVECAKTRKQNCGEVCIPVKSLGILVKHLGILQSKYDLFIYLKKSVKHLIQAR